MNSGSGQCVMILQHGTVFFWTLPLPGDLIAVVRELQRLSWFSMEESAFLFVHNIGVKPGDPAADVLFAFALYCLRTRMLEALRLANIMETAH